MRLAKGLDRNGRAWRQRATWIDTRPEAPCGPGDPLGPVEPCEPAVPGLLPDTGRFRVTDIPASFVAGPDRTLRWVGGPGQSPGDLEQAVEALAP